MPPENRPPNKNGMENRAHPRVETCNLISFTCLDGAGRPLRHGMGKALDISRSGLMLESSEPVEGERVSLMSSDPENRLVEIIGRVAYSRKSEAGGYQTGIQFSSTPEKNAQFATSLIKTFHYRRNRRSRSLRPTGGAAI